MIDLKQYEVWFVTGSQHLYGHETLEKVAEHSRQIARALDASAKIPVRVVFKPVLTTPEAIRDFCDRIGVAKNDSIVDIALLEHCLRQDLNATSPRAMAVLRPRKVVIDNYPPDLVEEMEAINNPEDPSAGTRKVPFSRVLYIEHDDFRFGFLNAW